MRPWGKDPDATFKVFDPMLAQVTMMASQKMKTFMQKVTYVLLVPVIEKGESSLQQFGLVSEALLNAVSDALTHEDLMSDNELGSLLSLREVLEPMLVLPSNNIQDKVDNMAGIRVLSKNNGSGSSALTLQAAVGSAMKMSGFWADKVEAVLNMECHYQAALITMQNDQGLLSDSLEKGVVERAATMPEVYKNLTKLQMIPRASG